ncbi:MAG: hypothetical protein PHF41_12105, partial [Massilibacteroides sp.]|nr:hypothetical protein [Massilibacteroides sp.]
MKNRIIHRMLYLLIGVFTFGTVMPVFARDGRLLIRQKGLFERNDTLFVQLDILFSGQVIGDLYALKLVPFLQSDTKRMDLPYVLINGKLRAAFFEREKALTYGQVTEKEPIYAYITQRGTAEQQEISYDMRIPFRPWMASARLGLKHIRRDCCSDHLLTLKMLDGDIALSTVKRISFPRRSSKVAYENMVDFLTMPIDAARIQSKYLTAYLDYPRGSMEVSGDYAFNGQELDRLRKEMTPLLRDSLSTLRRLVVTGCASPEGSYASNEQLAKGRAEGFKRYLIKTYELLDHTLFEVNHIAEDWDGLLRLLEKADIPAKEEVIGIIRTKGVFEGREKQLMDLKGGVPYREMMKKLFPQLRRIELR